MRLEEVNGLGYGVTRDTLILIVEFNLRIISIGRGNREWCSEPMGSRGDPEVCRV